ncbi:MAG: PKD domain-containing protein [Saprospiraceae bacterium]|nr:PKD domain-containing protein [Saprospiraceae bacterium]
MIRILVLPFFLFFGILMAQDITIQGSAIPVNPALTAKFNSVETYHIDVEETRLKFRNHSRSGMEVELILGGKSHILQLFKYNMYRPDCKIRHSTANGIVETAPNPDIETYRGYSANFGGQEAAVTFAKDYMVLMFREGDETYHLEQLPFEMKDRNPDHFILYDTKGVISNKNVTCGADEVTKFKTEHKHDLETAKERNRKCWEVDIALACDFTFYTFYRSDPAIAEARMTAILNFVQGDWYGGRLVEDYIYTISGIFIAEDMARDPWNGINDIFAQLNRFNQVGFTLFPGGFDVASCWTKKFTSGAVGVAFLPGTCVLTPFNICSEYTLDNTICRQLQSHELGHNWNCVHDPGGSPWIMAPVVNGSFQWSGASQWAISDWTFRIRACLGDCSAGDIPFAEFSADPTEGCLPLVVQYNNMSSNATTYKWNFPGGTPSTSTVRNPIVVYNSIGSFPVELEIANSKCSTKIEKLDYIKPRDKPRSVNFNYGAPNNGNEVEFFAYGDRVDTYKWKFHDGTTDEGDYVIKSYPKEGTFEVELCAENDCGKTCVKQKITNFFQPIADFTSDTTAGCAPATIKFFDQSSSNVINWTWSFPGGNPTGSFTKNPIIKYERPGKYQVKLVVSSLKNNAQITKDTFITIDSLPLAGFDPVVTVSTVKFNNTTLYGKSFKWEFGDGKTSTEKSPEHTYPDGRYEVKLTATNACGNTIIKKFVTVGAKPIAGFAVDNQNGCVPYTVQFQNTSTAKAQTFEWFFPGGNPSTSNMKDPIVTYNSIGKFDVKLIARAGIESDSISQQGYITVGEKPTSEFQNSVTGFTSFFTDISKKANTYFWEFGDGKTSTQKSPSHNYGVEGEFNVRLITQNECGADTMVKLIAVYLIPKVNFVSDTVRGCAPLKVKFLDRSSVDVLEWAWQFESGSPLTSSSKNPIVTFDKAGRYTVKLTVKNGNGTNSATKLRFIEVISPTKCPKLPPKKKSTDPTDNSQAFNDQIFSRSRVDYEVNVFPNPSNDEIFVQAKTGTKLTLLSLTGQVLLNRIVQNNTESMDVSTYEVGTYLLKVDHSDYNEVIKIIVNR